MRSADERRERGNPKLESEIRNKIQKFVKGGRTENDQSDNVPQVRSEE
jgi:hypothetical protein